MSIVLQRRIFGVIAEDDLIFHSAMGVLMMARPDSGVKRDNN